MTNTTKETTEVAIAYDAEKRRVALSALAAEKLGAIWRAANERSQEVLEYEMDEHGTQYISFNAALALSDSFRKFAQGRRLSREVETEHAILHKQLRGAVTDLQDDALVALNYQVSGAETYEQFSSAPIQW